MASLSLSDLTTVIITQPPSSRNPDLLDPSFVIFLFLILMVDRSRNLDPFKQKPKVDRSKGWLDPFKPKSTLTKRTNKEWMRKEEVDQTHWSRLKRKGWSDPLKQRVNEEWERRKKEADTREREKKWEKRRPMRQEREKINKIIINELQ